VSSARWTSAIARTIESPKLRPSAFAVVEDVDASEPAPGVTAKARAREHVGVAARRRGGLRARLRKGRSCRRSDRLGCGGGVDPDEARARLGVGDYNSEDGVPTDCAVYFDNVHTLLRSTFWRRVTRLSTRLMTHVCRTLRAALGC